VNQSDRGKSRTKKAPAAKSQENLRNLQFLEDMRTLSSRISDRSKLISIKVPENLLRAFRFACESREVKYQTQIKKLMAEWLDKEK
jgi:predicted DNA binding CopG/RHH family protein